MEEKETEILSHQQRKKNFFFLARYTEEFAFVGCKISMKRQIKMFSSFCRFFGCCSVFVCRICIDFLPPSLSNIVAAISESYRLTRIQKRHSREEANNTRQRKKFHHIFSLFTLQISYGINEFQSFIMILYFIRAKNNPLTHVALSVCFDAINNHGKSRRRI